MSFFGVFTIVALIVPILFAVALIVGLRGAARLGRGGAWWTMAVAAGLVILPSVLMLIGGLLQFPLEGTNPSGPNTLSQMFGFSFAIASFAGIPLFMIGFAMHGLKLARTAERIQELEQLTGAMTEEINRLDKGGRP